MKYVTAVWIGSDKEVSDMLRNYEIAIRGTFPLDDFHITELPSGKIVVIITAEAEEPDDTSNN